MFNIVQDKYSKKCTVDTDQNVSQRCFCLRDTCCAPL